MNNPDRDWKDTIELYDITPIDKHNVRWKMHPDAAKWLNFLLQTAEYNPLWYDAMRLSLDHIKRKV